MPEHKSTLSAAFDTVDHEILLERLQTEFGVEGMPLTSVLYLGGRTQYVKIGQQQHQSCNCYPARRCPSGVSTGTHPVRYVYASPVADVIASHGVQSVPPVI